MVGDMIGMTRGAQLRLVLALSGLFALGLQTANLVYFVVSHGCAPIALTCPPGPAPWVENDTSGYLSVAGDIRRKGLLGASYIERTPAYPLLLGVCSRVFGSPSRALWLAVLLAAGAAMAIAWMAFALSDRVWPAALAGLLFSVWPAAFQFTPQLLTDATHAYLAVMALAATLVWCRTEKPGAAVAAATLWVATQSVRLTFFPIAAVLPLLLWQRHTSQRRRVIASAVWFATWLVPVFVVTSNWAHHGVATPSVLGADTLALYAVPRLQEELGMGSFRDLRAAAWTRYEKMDARTRVAAELHEARETFRAHLRETVVSFWNEFVQQMRSPLRPCYAAADAALYPRWMSPPAALLWVFWSSAVVGLCVIARAQPQLALFLLLLAVMVMAPATMSHWVGARLRLPVDLIAIPVVAVGWSAIASAVRAQVVVRLHSR